MSSQVKLERLYTAICDLDYRATNDIIGKVLTIVDASFTDPQQREAVKSLVRESIFSSGSFYSKELTQIMKEYGEKNGLDLGLLETVNHNPPKGSEIQWFSSKEN